MSGRAFEDTHFAAFLTATRRIGEMIDRGTAEVGVEGVESDAHRLERLERALIRQRIVSAFLLSYVVSELRRDPARGPARIEQTFEALAAQSDEEWEATMAKADIEDAEAMKLDQGGQEPRGRPATPALGLADPEAALRKQARSETRERSQRRRRVLGR